MPYPRVYQVLKTKPGRAQAKSKILLQALQAYAVASSESKIQINNPTTNIMKEIPLLFSTPMVQANLDGRKTQTRRTRNLNHINIDPNNWKLTGWENVESDPKIDMWAKFEDDKNENEVLIQCPYGKKGDLFWVREEHYRWGHWERNGITKLGNEKWKFVADDDEIFYTDNMPYIFFGSREKSVPGETHWYKRLGRFMPKSVARIWLRNVTDPIPVRLQDISEDDAIAEGIEHVEGIEHKLYYNYVNREFGVISPSNSFESLWQSINGPDSWDHNPWVWKVKYEVLSTTGKPAINKSK